MIIIVILTVYFRAKKKNRVYTLKDIQMALFNHLCVFLGMTFTGFCIIGNINLFNLTMFW